MPACVYFLQMLLVVCRQTPPAPPAASAGGSRKRVLTRVFREEFAITAKHQSSIANRIQSVPSVEISTTRSPITQRGNISPKILMEGAPSISAT